MVVGSCLNSLSVLNHIKNCILSQDVPGNAVDKSRRTYYNHQPSVDSVSVGSYSSIAAYPLVKHNKDPPKVSTVPPAIKTPNKKRLAPTSIRIMDTISAVKSRTLLKVLFEPGSRSTLISCKCLPRYCKTCSIKQECKINTLAGSCKTKEVVVRRNLRLPELDKIMLLINKKL